MWKQLVWVQTLEIKKAWRSLFIYIGPFTSFGLPPGWQVTRRRRVLRRTRQKGRCCRLKTVIKTTWVQRYSASLTTDPTIHAHSQEGSGVIAASQLWLLAKLSYNTPTWNGFHTRVLYSPFQYTTEDPPPSSYEGAILGTNTYLESFSSNH